MVDLKDSPVGDTSADKEREARRFYNSVFREVPFWLKAAYRGPLIVLIILVALVVTLGLPLLAGVVALLVGAAIRQGDGSVLYWLGVWIVGFVVVGGAGVLFVALYAFWSATLDAIKRSFGLLRGE